MTRGISNTPIATLMKYKATCKKRKANGYVSPLKNKTLEEIHGIKKAKEIKQKRAKTKKENPYIFTIEQRKNISLGLTGRKLGKNSILKMKKTKRQKILDGWTQPSKNKTYEEMYGRKKAKEIRKKSHYSHLGNPNKNKGKTFEEIHGIKKAKVLKKQTSATLKEKHKNGELVCPKWMKEKGRVPWNKGIKTGIIPWTKKVAGTGIIKNKNKGKTLEQIYGKKKAKEIRFKIGIGSRTKNVGSKRSMKTRIKMSNSQTKLVLEGRVTKSIRGKNGYYISKNNGKVHYRSSWELACMKYFDKNKIDWVYEGEKNRLYLQTINKNYINDFYLPKENKYIQVKGYMPKDDKYFAFLEEHPELDIELWDRNVLIEKDII